MFRPFGKKDKSKNSKQQQPQVTADGGGNSGATGGGGAGASTTAAGAAPAGSKFDKLTLLTAMSLKEVSAADQPKLFRKHLQLCHRRFDFSGGDTREREAKRLVLLGLVDYINNPGTQLHESEFPDVMAMVAANIFRALPPRSDVHADADEDEPVLESAWPHLQIVYEFLLRFIVSSDVEPKVVKKYLSHSFIINLLGLFDSEDPRERDYLKTILHRVYGKLMAMRAFIRKSIFNVFMSAVYLQDTHNGIAELLEILGSIINGFALPLKAEHKRFLYNGLIPLHKVDYLGQFHQQLEYCICQFVEKDNQQATPVVLGLLRYWPQINSPKQVQFLHELEEVLELTQLPEFRTLIGPLFSRIALCLASQHFQVAERTLLLWNNEYLFTLITQNRSEVLPYVFDVLQDNANSHWNATVQSLSQNVLKSFKNTDKALFDEVAAASEAARAAKEVARADRGSRWSALLGDSPAEEPEGALDDNSSFQAPAPPTTTPPVPEGSSKPTTKTTAPPPPPPSQTPPPQATTTNNAAATTASTNKNSTKHQSEEAKVAASMANDLVANIAGMH